MYVSVCVLSLLDSDCATGFELLVDCGSLPYSFNEVYDFLDSGFYLSHFLCVIRAHFSGIIHLFY